MFVLSCYFVLLLMRKYFYSTAGWTRLMLLVHTTRFKQAPLLLSIVTEIDFSYVRRHSIEQSHENKKT